MRNSLVGPVILLVAAALLATSCASTTLTSVWKDDAYHKKPRKVVVMGMLKKPVNRRLIEDQFVFELKGRGLDAVAGYTIMPEDKLADKETLAARLKDVGADTLFLVRLLGTKTELNAVPGTAYASMPGYYNTGYQNVYAPGYVVEDKFAIAEATLFDVETEKLIWTAASETWITSTDQSLIKDYVAQVLKALQKQGLIEK